MEKIHVKTAVIIALIATVFGSLVVPSLVTARTGIMVQTASAVFSKVNGIYWVPLSTKWDPVMSIDLPFIGSSLYYKVECDGYLYLCNSTCGFAIGVDSPEVDPSTYRFYGYPNIEHLTGIHTERVYYLGPGAHSFYFLGRIIGLGVAYDAECCYISLTVTVFTHGSLEEPVAEFEADVDLTKLYEP
jgi:hypothetical protein